MKKRKKHNKKSIKSVNLKKITPFSELLVRYEGIEPAKAFWGGITPKSVGFIFGLAKSGKTIICENLALSITSGRDKFLGIPIELPKSKVLFISMEENVGIRIIQRGSKQIKGYSRDEKKNIKDNLYYSDEEFLRSIEGTKDWGVFEEQIEKHRPDVVFVDSTNRFNIDIENRKEANILMQKIREFAQKYECAILLIHHTNKAQKDKPITLEQMSGSSALGRDADLFIGINSLSSGIRYIKFLDNRYSQIPDKSILFSIQNNYLVDFEGKEYENELIKSMDNRYKSNNTEIILDFIKRNIDKEDAIKTKSLQSHFVEKNGIITKKTLHNQLKKLIELKQIEKVKHGIHRLIINNDINR